MLHQIQAKQQDILSENIYRLPPEVLVPPPKISKGENYQGLPYLILDHPRYFEKQNIFAVRTMFWWGNFFSVTLHVSGIYKKMLAKKFNQSGSLLFESGFYYCVNNEEWEHHFESTNYMLLKESGREVMGKQIEKSSFFKLAQKFPLQQWDEAEDMLLDYFKKMLEIAAV